MRISTQCLVIFNCYIYCLNIYIFCFILLFTSSSLCRKDQFAVSYFSTSLIVLIQVYNWEIRQWFVAVDLLTFYILYRSVSLVLSFVSNYYVFAFWGLLLYFPPDISTSPLFWGGEMPPLPQTLRIRRRWGRSVARALTNDVTKVET